MLRILLTCCLTYLVFLVQAQNLVPNPSFETIGICPIKHGETAAKFDGYTQSWYSANIGSPDLFTPCSGQATTTPLNIIPPTIFTGIQTARTGTNFIGLYHYGLCEYAANTLSQPLTKDKNYKVSFFVSCADKQKSVTDALGMYISDTQIKIRTGSSNPAITNVTPQIVSTPGVFLNNTDWIEISGYYTAKGGEQYITMGCFFDYKTNNILSSHVRELSTAVTPSYGAGEARLYYYIDDVSLSQTISGPVRACLQTEQTYDIDAVPGASSYTWTLPNGWTGTSSTNSITTMVGTTGGTITVVADDIANTTYTLDVTIETTIPAQPGTITGDEVLCAEVTKTFNVDEVANATSYVWTLPNEWEGTSYSRTISLKPNSSNGTISVKAANNCGISSERTLDIEIMLKPDAPTQVSGPTTVCVGHIVDYSVAAVTDATYYTWSNTAGWSGTSITKDISFTAGTNGGDINVTASNGCGTSASAQLTVTTVNTTPDQPGTITGATTLCNTQTGNYSIAAVNDATYYTWQLPDGWDGTSVTETISITSATGNGIVKVSAGNACGNSDDQSISIVSSPPAQPGTITGASSLCLYQSETYQVSPVSNATSYSWQIPTGWYGTSTSESITATAIEAGGIIRIKAHNDCGASTEQTFTATVRGITAEITAANSTFTSVLADSYQWVDCDDNYSPLSITTRSFTPTQSGNYSVIISVDGCTDTADCIQYALVPTGLLSTSATEALEVFPNPAGQFLKIKTAGNPIAEISLLDYTGKPLCHYANVRFSSNKEVEIPLAEIAPGIYLVRVLYKNEEVAIKTISVIK